MEMAYLCSSQFHQLAAREFTLCCLTCMASKWFWLADEISARQWASDFRSSSPGWLGFYLGFLTIWWAIPRVTTMREQGGIFPYLTLEVFSNESTICIRWTKYWSFSFSIIPCKEHPGLISFRMDWVGSPWNTPMLCYAKSLQSCPTLCDPRDGSTPGSPVPGILQARTLEWIAISFSNAWKWKVKVKSLSGVRLLATPWTAAHQAPPSMGFSRQVYWSGVPLPSPWNTPRFSQFWTTWSHE